MKIAAICCTFNRPEALEEAIESFLRQDYPSELREMIVLDDAGQYRPDALDNIPGVKLITTKHRFRTLGEKRNASAALVSPDTEVYCPWDDDDIYLPWHMSAAAKGLANAQYTIPTQVYVDKRTHFDKKKNGTLFHAAWSFRRDVFSEVGGYPFMQSGQDQGLLKRFLAANVSRTDPIQWDPRPSFVYRWYTAHNQHLSAMGNGGYERLGFSTVSPVESLVPKWEKDWVALHTQFAG